MLTKHFNALLRNKFYYQSYIKSFTLELLADFLSRLRSLPVIRQVSPDYRATVKIYKITRFTA